MSIASSYARALYDLVSKDQGSASTYLKNLRMSLVSRGHLKLAPAIASEYHKLEVQKERGERHRKVTPQKERVRILLELYKKLIETK